MFTVQRVPFWLGCKIGCLSPRLSPCVEQRAPPERIRIGLYAFENQLSSGVNHLRMLVVSTEYFIKWHHICARYLISVRDELVKEDTSPRWY